MIFIVGAHATGKTYLADAISKFNFARIDLGPVLRIIYSKSGSQESFSEWIQNGEKQFGPHFSNDLLVNEIKLTLEKGNAQATQPLDYIIIGNRSILGLKYISEHIERTRNRDNTIIFLDAPFDILYERYKKREGGNITIKQFKEILDRDRKMGLEDLRSFANFVIINDSTREKLVDQTSAILRDELKYQLRENALEVKIKIS
jgi:dephospho-CoA kinase